MGTNKIYEISNLLCIFFPLQAKLCLSQCCSRFWSHCFGRYLTMWLASSVITLINSRGTIHILSFGKANGSMFTQSYRKKIHYCLLEHQLFTKLIKLVFCCASSWNWVVSKSNIAISPAELKVTHHHSVNFLQIFLIHYNWIPCINPSSHFSFFHWEDWFPLRINLLMIPMQ